MSTTGLRFDDLTAWQKWSGQQRRPEALLRQVKGHVRPATSPPATLWRPVDDPQTLVVLDKLTPSCRAAVHDPIAHLDVRTTAVLSHELPELGETHTAEPWLGTAALPRTIESVLSLGSYLALSAAVKQWALGNDVRFAVVQHGLLTPWSPPAADGDHLLAWTDADAEYWRDGRSAVSAEVVGSQMFWAAAAEPPVEVMDGRPVVLGQLHGIELSRRTTFGEYWRLCREHAMDYRPHPNESDAVSRGLHEVMRRGGIQFDSSDVALTELRRPVVSIFSTGTLEAAQRGLPAWVHLEAPPPWIEDFWGRYRLSRWGSAPTPRWEQPAAEPARTVALALSHR